MLIVLTIVSMLAGAWVIWDLGRILARIDQMQATIDQKEAEINCLKEKASKDDITPLYNRGFLLSRLKEEAVQPPARTDCARS